MKKKTIKRKYFNNERNKCISKCVNKKTFPCTLPINFQNYVLFLENIYYPSEAS